MTEDDGKAETKFSGTFHFKFLFAAIVFTVLVIGLYYVISPYQNCYRVYPYLDEDLDFCFKYTDW